MIIFQLMIFTQQEFDKDLKGRKKTERELKKVKRKRLSHMFVTEDSLFQVKRL